MKLLELFEKDLFKIVEKIKFRKINCEFQDKLNSDIKGIKSSRKTLTPADKTSNFYKITKEKYVQRLDICFFVGLGNRIVEKLLVISSLSYFIKIGRLISRC